MADYLGFGRRRPKSYFLVGTVLTSAQHRYDLGMLRIKSVMRLGAALAIALVVGESYSRAAIVVDVTTAESSAALIDEPIAPGTEVVLDLRLSSTPDTSPIES